MLLLFQHSMTEFCFSILYLTGIMFTILHVCVPSQELFFNILAVCVP